MKYNIKFTIFRIFKCAVQLNAFMLLCNHPHHPSPELFLSCKTETLSPLNINTHSPLSPAPGNHHSSFWLIQSIFKYWLHPTMWLHKPKTWGTLSRLSCLLETFVSISLLRLTESISIQLWNFPPSFHFFSVMGWIMSGQKIHWNTNSHAMEWIFVPFPPPIHMSKSNAQCVGIGRWGLWEVLIGHKGVTLLKGINVLIKDPTELPSPLSPAEDQARSQQSATWKTVLTRLNLPVPWFWMS